MFDEYLFQIHDYLPSAIVVAFIPIFGALFFVGHVVGILRWGSLSKNSDAQKEGQGGQSHQQRSSSDGVSEESPEPACWDFSEIKPLEGFNWQEAEEIPYRPFSEGPYFLTMGLKAMLSENWIELDKTYISRLNYKRQLFSQHREETVAFLPDSASASFEALEMLVDFLPRRYPSMFRRTAQGIENFVTGENWDLRRSSDVWLVKKTHPLEVMGYLTTEDWVIMQKDPEGGDDYHLRAGAVCFPSGWQLPERLGHSLYRIHAGNVPQYEPRIAKSMDRFFAKLKVSSPIQRFGNRIELSPELFYIHPQHDLSIEELENLKIDGMFLRVERQTLRRLPRSRALLFGIRTYVTPVTEVTKNNKEVARVLKAQIESYPEDMAIYKGRHIWKTVVMDHLDSVLRSSEGGDDSPGVQGASKECR